MTRRRERSMKLLIVIPAYNEADNIERVITELQQYSYDYIIVNDGSADKTAEICRKNGYHLLDLPVNLGLTGAVQAGMKYAFQNGYDCAVQLDGDGQHDPAYLAKMMEQMRDHGDDIVIGSRFVTEKKPSSLRMMGSNLIQFAIRLTTGKNIQDPTSGLRLYNRQMLGEFVRDFNLTPEPDTLCYLMRCGAEVSEIQVEMRERIAGESYLNLTRSIQYMLRMGLSILLIQWFRDRKPIRKEVSAK